MEADWLAAKWVRLGSVSHAFKSIDPDIDLRGRRLVSVVCGVEIYVDAERVGQGLEAAETIPLEGPACTKCYDALVDELVEDESLEDALNRGYVPVILED